MQNKGVQKIIFKRINNKFVVRIIDTCVEDVVIFG